MMVTRRWVGSAALAPCANCSTMSSGAKRWNDCSMCSRRSIERVSAVRCRPTSARSRRAWNASAVSAADHAGERDGERNRHTWSIVSRTQPLASAAAPDRLDQHGRPQRLQQRAGALLDASRLLRHPHRVARPRDQQRLHLGEARRCQRFEHLGELAAREALDVEELGGAGLAELALERVRDDREDQAQRAPRQHLGGERVVQGAFERGRRRRSLQRAHQAAVGALEVRGRVVRRRQGHRRSFRPAARPTACSRSPSSVCSPPPSRAPAAPPAGSRRGCRNRRSRPCTPAPRSAAR